MVRRRWLLWGAPATAAATPVVGCTAALSAGGHTHMVSGVTRGDAGDPQQHSSG
jgi:hypothetical protein